MTPQRRAYLEGKRSKLEAAKFSGQSSISFQGQVFTWRSLADLDQLIAQIDRELNGTKPTRLINPIVSKGLY